MVNFGSAHIFGGPNSIPADCGRVSALRTGAFLCCRSKSRLVWSGERAIHGCALREGDASR